MNAAVFMYDLHREAQAIGFVALLGGYVLLIALLNSGGNE